MEGDGQPRQWVMDGHAIFGEGWTGFDTDINRQPFQPFQPLSVVTICPIQLLRLLNTTPSIHAPKLLVISYACAPGKGSEWGAGWNFVREMARTNDVYLITHDDNRADIETFLPTFVDRDRVHVRYVGLSKSLGWMRDSAYALLNLHYYFWQKLAARVAIGWHDEVHFDIVQHISYMRWWMPSAGSALASRGVKFIFGPVVGGEVMPKQFRKRLSFANRFGEWQRRMAMKVWSFDPALAKCIRSASLVICGTRNSLNQVQKFGPQRVELMASGTMSDETILNAARLEQSKRPRGDRFRVVSVGGMSYFRGIDLCLRAFAKAALPDAEYIHCCDGPERHHLRQLVRELGIEGRVTFTGDRKHAENVKTVGRGDVYIHGVLRDSMGTIPEAMWLGLPVLTLDHNTPGLMVDSACGHKVKIDDSTTPEEIIDEMARVLRDWYANPELIKKLGEAGAQRCQQFSISARGEQNRAFHRLVLESENLSEKSTSNESLSARNASIASNATSHAAS
ncbi:MAG TPA: glycosyltransferase [Tepidisphaeraceae bacterium]|nr:glycosyltransferase [Tepidisphaeraceae bacterium]